VEGNLAVLIAAVMGLMVGSFLTVVIHRVPQGLSVVAPRSACPVCGTQIRARDNIPVLSYLALRGRCHSCHTSIPVEYPLTEAATGVLFAVPFILLASPWRAGFIAPFLAVLLACSVIDIRNRIIPNRIVLPALVLFGAAAVVLQVAGRGLNAWEGLIGLLAFGGSLFLIAMLVPGGMGMGDVKLAALIGLVLGAMGLSYVAVAAGGGILLGGVGAVVALATGRSRKDTIPFGPYLAMGAALAAFTAPSVAGWYGGFIR
jgi:leader peptidase (prepilin peptidase)/N-methyltransferase